jgi:L-alanine-DL-glutamate epimerase-like enolase superfamily enzyme
LPIFLIIHSTEQKRNFVEKFALTEPERDWHYLHHLLPNHPFLVAALDMAAWDLFGKMEQQPIYKIWGLTWENTPLTDYTIGIDSEEKMIQKMLDKPRPIYKIKLGFENDVALVTALRNKTNAVIRVDANAGWTLEEALIKIPELKKLGVEFIEQTLAKENWEGMKVLFQQSPLPLIADESCVSEHDVAKCKDHFHGINIKLTKSSGSF